MTELNYDIRSNESEQTVVLIHGLFGDRQNLANQARALASDANVISIDLPNHGNSPWVDTFDFTDCARSIVQVLDKENVQTCVLLGHSLGGKVAMMTALLFPERITQLMVADIAPATYSPKHNDIIAALTSLPLDSISSRQDAQEHMATYLSEPGTVQFLLKSLYKDDLQQWRWRFNLAGLSKDYDTLRDWPATDETAYTGPTLFIKGSRSDYLTEQHRSSIAKHFPNAKAHIIEGAGHWLHAEKPTAFNKIMLSALKANAN